MAAVRVVPLTLRIGIDRLVSELMHRVVGTRWGHLGVRRALMLRGAQRLLHVPGAAWDVSARVCWRCEREYAAVPRASGTNVVSPSQLLRTWARRGGRRRSSARPPTAKCGCVYVTQTSLAHRLYEPWRDDDGGFAPARCSGGDWTTPARRFDSRIDSKSVCTILALTPLPWPRPVGFWGGGGRRPATPYVEAARHRRDVSRARTHTPRSLPP